MIVAIVIPMFVYIFVHVFKNKWLVSVVFLGPFELLTITCNDKLLVAIHSLGIEWGYTHYARAMENYNRASLTHQTVKIGDLVCLWPV